MKSYTVRLEWGRLAALQVPLDGPWQSWGRLRRRDLSGDRDSDLDIDTWLDGQGGDVLDESRRSLQVDVSLVDSHLVVLPGLRTLTVRGLSGGDRQSLGWHSDRTLLLDALLGGVSDDQVGDLLQGLDVGGGEGDSDLVDLLWLFDILLFDRHCG